MANSGQCSRLNVYQSRQATAESTKQEIEKLHYQMYARLYEATNALVNENGMDEIYHQRLQRLYGLERRMASFAKRATARYEECASRESGDKTDFPQTIPSPKNPEIRPAPLIYSVDGRLTVNKKMLIKLRKVHGRIGVLGMAGTYRTGKSFVLSRIMGEQGGFPVDSRVRACTQGIWIWGKQIEGTDKIDYLLVLDTEGLRDPKKGDRRNDTSIFALTMLLSSYLVYNAMNVIDFSAIRDLHLVANLQEHIRCRIQQDEKRVMPKFCWLVRDFSLSLEIDGQPCTEDEYLENALKLREDGDPQANDIKRYLRETFPDRQCVCLCKPTEDDHLLQHLDMQDYNSLRHQFTSKLDDFIHRIYTYMQPLTIMGQELTGSMFGTLTEEYVKAINRGAVPDIPSTFASLTEIECKRAFEESNKMYKTKMDNIMSSHGLPVDDSRLLKWHEECEQKAMKHFDESSIGDGHGSQNYRKALQDSIAMYREVQTETGEKYLHLTGGMYMGYVQDNETKSAEFCEALLRLLYESIQNKLVGQEYIPPKGTLEDFFRDLDKLKDDYLATANKGPRAFQVIFDFFERNTNAEQLINFTRILSEADREIMKERERQTEMYLRMLKNNEDLKKLKDDQVKQRRSHLLALQTIHNKSKQHQQQLKKEHENKLAFLYYEQQCLIAERLNEESRRIRGQIQELTRHHEQEQRQQNAEIERLRQSANETEREIERLRSLPDRQSSGGGGGGGGSCFSAWSSVRVKDKINKSIIRKQLWQLSIGDEVESVDPINGEQTFSLVYFIIHDEDDSKVGQELLQIDYEGGDKRGSITLHRNHLIYISENEESLISILQKGPVCADQVIPGMMLWIMKESTIEKAYVTSVQQVSGHPVRHPLTLNHYIIVDDVIASVHMFNESLYRFITSPLRGLYTVAPGLCTNRTVKKIVALWDLAEEWIPLTF